MEVKCRDEKLDAPWKNPETHTPWQNTKPVQPPQRKQDEGKEESLTTILNEEQRGQLTLLIATAMAAMRKTITSGFDANVSTLWSYPMFD